MSPINKGIQFFVAGVFTLAAITSAAESHKFEMTVEEVTLSIAPGFTSKVWAYDGQVPGPFYRDRSCPIFHPLFFYPSVDPKFLD